MTLRYLNKTHFFILTPSLRRINKLFLMLSKFLTINNRIGQVTKLMLELCWLRKVLWIALFFRLVWKLGCGDLLPFFCTMSASHENVYSLCQTFTQQVGLSHLHISGESNFILTSRACVRVWGTEEKKNKVFWGFLSCNSLPFLTHPG